MLNTQVRGFVGLNGTPPVRVIEIAGRLEVLVG